MYKIVSFYTPDYEPYARELIRSIEEVCPGVEYDVRMVPARTWADATNFKAEFILEQMRLTNKDILWIDADATVLQKPEFPEGIEFAIYARFSSTLRRRFAPFRTGTVYFANTPVARKLVLRWKTQGSVQTDGIDQWSLFRAWAAAMQYQDEMPSTHFLPKAYCQKFDENDDDPIIIHHMASRKHKHKKGGSGRFTRRRKAH